MKKRKRSENLLPEKQNSSEEKLDTAKKHAVQAGVALAASAALIAGGLFNSPADLARNQTAGTLDRAFTPAFEQVLREQEEDKDPEDPTETEGAGNGNDGGQKNEAQTLTASDRIRNHIYRIPVIWRILVGIPVWAVGWILKRLIRFALGAVLPAAAGKIISWICIAGIVLASVAAALKAVFPDLPLKKILNRKTMLAVGISVLLLAAADTVLSCFSQEYSQTADTVKLIGSLVIVLGSTVLFTVRRKKPVHWLPERS